MLNAPWTSIALALALLSMPTQLETRRHTIIIRTRTFWWHPSKGMRAMTLGNIILLGKATQQNDLKHELIHIEQHMREPFVHPILAAIQLAKYGPKNSKYEKEAYAKADNKFIDR